RQHEDELVEIVTEVCRQATVPCAGDKIMLAGNLLSLADLARIGADEG
ncbi:MAG: hypothetical protein RL145_2297, partial [Pseudomonadota bacterium]